jgi:hypothetical protein
MKPKIGIFLLTLLAVVTILAFGSSVTYTRAQQPNRVGLVVDFGDDYITRCVEFSEPEITGHEVLRRAGLDLVVDTSNPMGVIICDINNTSGCPASNCFCECQGSPCVYWAYHRLVDGSWQYSQLGASSQKAENGDVEGWAWGEGALNTSGAKPPLKAFEEICARPINTPVPSTNTSVPSTNTPVPPTETSEPEPEDTPVPELVVWFRLDQNPIPTGSCTVVRWDTTYAQEVYLDGEKVDLIDSREVCPTEPREYNLRVVGPEDEETHTLVLGVTGGQTSSTTPRPTIAPSSPTPTTQAGTTALPSPSPSPAATATSPPTPSATVQPASTPSPTRTPEPTTSPSPTSPPATQTTPPQTPTTAAQPDSADQSAEDGAGPVSFYTPATYAVFALIVGGLLGWLVFLVKVRK